MGEDRKAMSPAARELPMKIGDIVNLIGLPTRFIVRDLLPDGKHAVCERTASAGSEAFFAAPSTSYASYILALKDLEKR